MSFDEDVSPDHKLPVAHGNDQQGGQKSSESRGSRASSRQDGGKSDDGSQGGEQSKQDGSKDGGNKDDKDKPNRPRSKKPLIIVGLIVVILAVVGFIVWFLHRNEISTDDAFTDGNTVGMVPKVSGYVVKLYVDDNTPVHKGDMLVQLDPRDYLAAQAQATAQLSLAQAQLKTAKDALRIASVQYPAQYDSARAQQEAAAASLALARQQYERQHEVDRRATTQENIDASTSQQRNAEANFKSAKAQAAVASLVPEQVQQAANAVAEREAQVQQAQAQLDQADLNLGYTDIRAPQDGFVTQRNVQLGTFASAGQTMFLLVTREAWVTANFKESQIGRMRPGQRVEIEVDAYSGYKLSGHVQSIQFGSGARFSSFPAENATGNFVKIVQRVPVKIMIDRGLDPKRPLPIGLSVVPTVYFE